MKHVKIELDPLKDIHDLCFDRAKGFASKIVERFMFRYCGVCFFGDVAGYLGGIPICKECVTAIVGKENPSTEEMSKSIEDVKKFAMRSRDAFEYLWMKIAEETKKEG